MKLKYIIIALLLFSNYSFPQTLFEPDTGCYIGAYIVNDDYVKGDVDLFEVITQKKHSFYLNYTAYGKPFPKEWVNYYVSKNAIVQIAFEPRNGLNEVKDTAYITEWAREAHKSGAMILLRWASDMNLPTVKWWGEPQKYIEKFRLIHDVMAKEAPNVAMVWNPAYSEYDTSNYVFNMHYYYPGDEYVDWVGINFFGQYYTENALPERIDPRLKLRQVYDVYSNRRPIIIGEWAAANYTERVNPPQGATSYAIDQMDALYKNIKTQFPKLKAVCWFSMSTLSINKNNYSLTDDSRVLTNYINVVKDGYFRSDPYTNMPFISADIIEDFVVKENISFRADIDCDAPIDNVIFYLDNVKMQQIFTAPYVFNLDITSLSEGYHIIKISAQAKSGLSNFKEIRIIVDKSNRYNDLILDDDGVHFSLEGDWQISSSQTDSYGGSYHFSLPGSGLNKATWAILIPETGTYQLYAWWSEDVNRASDAPYSITHSSGITTVRVNQKTNGGKWNLLGSYFYVKGNTALITLSNNANDIVIADAVRIVWSFPTNVSDESFAGGNTSLLQNYPNPFNAATKISYYIDSDKRVKLSVYDLLGREAAKLVDEEQTSGSHEIIFSGENLPSGIYFIRLIAGRTIHSKKVMLLK